MKREIFNWNCRVGKADCAKIPEKPKMLNKDFVKWVAIAFVVATPIVWFAMNKWLESFAYKTELSWWIVALFGLMALGIALLTVSWSRVLGRKRQRGIRWRR